MGSKPTKQKDKPGMSPGMSPGESMAKFGTVEAAGLQQKDLDRLSAEQRRTFQDILKEKTTREMEYGRPVQIAEGVDKFGRPRAFAATAPTLSQLGGDIKRAIFGGTAFTKAAGLPDPRNYEGILKGVGRFGISPATIGVNMIKEALTSKGVLPPMREQQAPPIEAYLDATVGGKDKLFRGLKRMAIDEENFDKKALPDVIQSLLLKGIGQKFFKDGGLTETVPPVSGPLSSGIASLFKNK